MNTTLGRWIAAGTAVVFGFIIWKAIKTKKTDNGDIAEKPEEPTVATGAMQKEGLEDLGI
jgi:hypothetical protein